MNSTGNCTWKKCLLGTLIIFFLAACTESPPKITKCGDYPFDPAAKKITPDILAKYPLDYTKIVKDHTGTPILKVEYKYIGRCPDLELYNPPNQPYAGPDYNKKRFTFYKVRYENLSDNSITFLTLTTDALFHKTTTKYFIDEKGNRVEKKEPVRRQRDYSEKPKHRGNELKPHEIRDRSTGCHTANGEVYLDSELFTYNGEKYTVDLHMVCH